jgi:REP element-mobilizing transposase RayT
LDLVQRAADGWLVLKGEIAVAVRDLTRQVCHAHDIEILAGHVLTDHFHLLLSVFRAPARYAFTTRGATAPRA